MKNTKAVVLTALTIIIAVGTIGYTQRVEIADYFRASQQPDVPESVGYEDFADTDSEEAERPKEDQGTETEEGQSNEGQDIDDDTEDEQGDGNNGNDETRGVEEVSEEVVNEGQGDAQEVSGAEAGQNDIATNPEADQGRVGASNEGTASASQESEPEPSESTELPAEINLAVPFTPQAPHGDWSPPFKEACEEASVYMVQAYYNGVPEGRIDPNTAEADLRQIVEFEKSIFGYYKDTTAQKTGIFAEQFYGFTRIETIQNPTIDDIKRHVAAGRPVIVPAAGRALNNPYYTPPGPYYHMYVIRGYTNDGFITNDPGTRRGEGYVYRYDKVMDSMHDYNAEDMQKGERVVIVIYPEE